MEVAAPGALKRPGIPGPPPSFRFLYQARAPQVTPEVLVRAWPLERGLGAGIPGSEERAPGPGTPGLIKDETLGGWAHGRKALGPGLPESWNVDVLREEGAGSLGPSGLREEGLGAQISESEVRGPFGA